MEEVSITVLRNNTEGFLCKQQASFMQMFIHAIGRQGFYNFFGQFFFELEAVNIKTAVVFLREDEVDDLIPTAHDFLQKWHPFRKAKIMEDIIINKYLATLDEMFERNSGLKHLTDGIMIIQIQSLNQQIPSLLYKLLIA